MCVLGFMHVCQAIHHVYSCKKKITVNEVTSQQCPTIITKCHMGLIPQKSLICHSVLSVTRIMVTMARMINYPCLTVVMGKSVLMPIKRQGLLHYIILYIAMLCCAAILYYTILYCTILYCRRSSWYVFLLAAAVGYLALTGAWILLLMKEFCRSDPNLTLVC